MRELNTADKLVADWQSLTGQATRLSHFVRTIPIQDHGKGVVAFLLPSTQTDTSCSHVILRALFHGGQRQTRLFLHLFSLSLPSLEEQTWVKSGYFYAGSEIPVSDIDSSLFFHLICAFASIGSSTHPLSFNASFEQIFSTFTSTVKRKNPSITTLLSVWAGGEASSALASMLGKFSSRKFLYRVYDRKGKALCVQWD
ncbi:hypothetical protein NL676_036298 [Syzygium grande]|nr:hypothetical protein NL676_036298 [Syzygium grande]